MQSAVGKFVGKIGEQAQKNMANGIVVAATMTPLGVVFPWTPRFSTITVLLSFAAAIVWWISLHVTLGRISTRIVACELLISSAATGLLGSLLTLGASDYIVIRHGMGWSISSVVKVLDADNRSHAILVICDPLREAMSDWIASPEVQRIEVAHLGQHAYVLIPAKGSLRIPEPELHAEYLSLPFQSVGISASLRRGPVAGNDSKPHSVSFGPILKPWSLISAVYSVSATRPPWHAIQTSDPMALDVLRYAVSLDVALNSFATMSSRAIDNVAMACKLAPTRAEELRCSGLMLAGMQALVDGRLAETQVLPQLHSTCDLYMAVQEDKDVSSDAPIMQVVNATLTECYRRWREVFPGRYEAVSAKAWKSSIGQFRDAQEQVFRNRVHQDPSLAVSHLLALAKIERPATQRDEMSVLTVDVWDEEIESCDTVSGMITKALASTEPKRSYQLLSIRRLLLWDYMAEGLRCGLKAKMEMPSLLCSDGQTRHAALERVNCLLPSQFRPLSDTAATFARQYADAMKELSLTRPDGGGEDVRKNALLQLTMLCDISAGLQVLNLTSVPTLDMTRLDPSLPWWSSESQSLLLLSLAAFALEPELNQGKLHFEWPKSIQAQEGVLRTVDGHALVRTDFLPLTILAWSRLDDSKSERAQIGRTIEKLTMTRLDTLYMHITTEPETSDLGTLIRKHANPYRLRSHISF